MEPPAEAPQQSEHRICCTFTGLGAATLNCIELKVSACTIREEAMYEEYPENKDTKVLNMYNNFNLQKRHCEWIACT